MFPLFPLLEQHSESLYTLQCREAFIIRANDSSQRIELAVAILRRPAPPAHPPERALHSNRKTLDYYSDPQNMMSKDSTIEKFPLLEQHSESLYTSQYSESFWFEDDLEIEFYECNEALADDLTVGTTLTAKPLAQAKKDFSKRMAQKVNQIETLAKKLSDLEFALASSKAAVAALKAVTEINAVHIPPPSLKIEPATAHHGGATTTNVIGSYFEDRDKVNFQPLPDPLRALRTIDILIERDKSNKRYEASCASLHVSVQPESVWLDYYSDPQNMMSKDSSCYANNCPGYYDGAHYMHLKEEALSRTPNMPSIPKQWPQQSPRAAQILQCGPEREVLFLSEALGIKQNCGPGGVVQVIDVSPDVPGSPIARQGNIEVGDKKKPMSFMADTTTANATKHISILETSEAPLDITIGTTTNATKHISILETSEAPLDITIGGSVDNDKTTTDFADKDSLRIIRWIDILIERDKIFCALLLYLSCTVQALLCTVPEHLLVLHEHFTLLSPLFSFSTFYVYLRLAHRVQ
jgi:hypothetical protein